MKTTVSLREVARKNGMSVADLIDLLRRMAGWDDDEIEDGHCNGQYDPLKSDTYYDEENLYY